MSVKARATVTRIDAPRLLVAALLWACLSVAPLAQAPSPQTQPRLEAGSVTYLGSFAVPWSDGTCPGGTGSQRGCLAYGSFALGLGPVVDGQPTMFYGGHDWDDQLCQITIPAIGGTAQMVGRCQTIAQKAQVDPSGGGNGYVLGGSLLHNGRLLVTATSYYPGGDTATRTHFVSSAGLAGLTGAPVRVGTIKAAMVAGYMGTVPPEWRSLLGGPALTGWCCTSIIGRSSHGPAVGVFDPDTVGTQNPAPLTPLVYYPDEARALAPYSSPTPSLLFNGSTNIGGVAFPSGSRSVLFIGRQGTGARCYGTGTTNKALHNTPHPQGERWCYDPTNSYKGDHAYPYRHQVWAYDATDLLAVKAGTRHPWEVTPYATWPITGMPSAANQSATLRSAAYDDTTRRVYVTETTGTALRVHVYQIAGATAPPPSPVDCQLSEPGAWQAVTPWSACVDGTQSQQQRRTRSIDVPPAHGGAACGPTDETQTAVQPCTVEPPPEPETFTTTVAVPVGARAVTVQVPVTVGTASATIPLTVDVPPGQTTATLVCSKPAGGAWACVRAP